MEPSGISAEEFSRLQNHLIELRTQNYEILEKFKKTTEENNLLREKAESKEKDLQKLNKLMKFPGFQSLTKNRNKKSYEDIVEENERLIQQMQRHEEDFNLQNKTLLEEVSRLSIEKDSLDAELEKLKDTRTRQHDESDELRRIKAENTVLLKKVKEQGNAVKGTENGTEEITLQLHTDSDSNKSNQTVNEMIEDLKEFMNSEFRQILENRETKKNTKDDSNVIDEDERKFIEKILKSVEDLLRKAGHGSSTGEFNVQLETERTENSLLRDQLEGEREQTQKDIAVLKSEIDKLTEKTKRKQESYNQLQEEKETLHEEKRYLEQEWIGSKEKLAMAEEKLMELEQKMESASEENDQLREEAMTLKQQVEECSTEKVAELERLAKEKNEELLSLKSQLEELAASNQDLMSELQKLSLEKEEIESISKNNHELAEKRKKLLDEISVERQHELTSHNKELEESKKQTEEERKQLEACMSDLEKTRREVTLASDRYSELLKKYSSLDKKSGWLERTLKETESQIEEEHQNHLHVLENKDKEMQEKIDALNVEHELEIKAINESKENIEHERDEKICIIEKMNQANKDREIEFRISGKKGDQLLRDLKKQLKTERKRADQIQQRLQDFLTDSKNKQTLDEIFKTDPSFYKGHRRQDSGSHLSTVSSNSGLEPSFENDNAKSSTPLSGTPLSGGNDSYKLSNETVELISKVSDLQLEKNVLEEKVRHLEENNSVLVDDLIRKTEIIQKYVRDTKADLHPESVRKKNMTLKEKMKDSLNIGKHGKSEDMLKEMNAKMQRLLEETLEKNLQLEKDVDHLTRELEKAFKSD